MPLPAYYSCLGPFRKIFRSGHALLTYHHVGPRPRRVRLKGLYIGQRLFAKQLAEWQAEGFSAPPYDSLFALSDPEPRVFLTFDDGFCDVFHLALPLLREHRFRAIEFIVADLVGKTSQWQEREDDAPAPLMDKAQIKDWLAAGNQIGSHSMSHPFLTKIPAARAQQEITASKKKLEDLFGQTIRHFCYPFGDWNEAVRDLVAEAGYETACTTEFGVNSSDADRFALKRITARYPSRSLKSLRAWVRRRLVKN